MINIKSVRRGFANNSSSSHSIAFLSKENYDKVRDSSNEYQYGWDYFTIKSRSEKEKYLFTNLICVLSRHIRIDTNILSYSVLDKLQKDTTVAYLNEHRKLLPFEYFDTMLSNFQESENYNMYVDHQSVLSIPVDETGKLNIQFYSEFCKELIDKNYVILGGNDNDGDPHDLQEMDMGVSEIIRMLI